MDCSEIRKGVGGESKVECLARLNFEEIRNLIKYITSDLVPKIKRLEDEVQRFKDLLAPRQQEPLFCLTIDDDDDSE